MYEIPNIEHRNGELGRNRMGNMKTWKITWIYVRMQYYILYSEMCTVRYSTRIQNSTETDVIFFFRLLQLWLLWTFVALFPRNIHTFFILFTFYFWVFLHFDFHLWVGALINVTHITRKKLEMMFVSLNLENFHLKFARFFFFFFFLLFGSSAVCCSLRVVHCEMRVWPMSASDVSCKYEVFEYVIKWKREWNTLNLNLWFKPKLPL